MNNSFLNVKYKERDKKSNEFVNNATTDIFDNDENSNELVNNTSAYVSSSNEFIDNATTDIFGSDKKSHFLNHTQFS